MRKPGSRPVDVAFSVWTIISIPAILVLFLMRASRTHPPSIGAFEVLNDSGAEVRVTPIGRRRETDEHAPLRLRSGRPTTYRLREPGRDWCNVRLAAGQSVRIVYHWDEANFRHILVRNRQGEFFLLDTDRRGTRSECLPPEREQYVIPRLSELRRAPPELIPCAAGKTVQLSNARKYPDGGR